MLHGNNRLTRLIAAGLAIAAIAPAASVPQPIDGQGPGPVAVSVLRSGTCFRRIGERRTRPVPRAARRMGGTPRFTRCTARTSAPTAPQWPINPQPIGHATATASARSSDDGGLGAGIWVAIGGAAAVAAAGLGLAGQKPP